MDAMDNDNAMDNLHDYSVGSTISHDVDSLDSLDYLPSFDHVTYRHTLTSKLPNSNSFQPPHSSNPDVCTPLYEYAEESDAEDLEDPGYEYPSDLEIAEQKWMFNLAWWKKWDTWHNPEGQLVRGLEEYLRDINGEGMVGEELSEQEICEEIFFKAETGYSG